MHLLKKTVQKVLGYAGWEVRRKPVPTTPRIDQETESDVYHVRGHKLLKFLKKLNVTVLLDVGANLGQYASALRELGFEGRIISFEPLSKQCVLLKERSLNDKDWECHQCATGDADGHIVINVAGNSESSSILPMLGLHVDAYPASAYVDKESVQIRRLDSILENEISDSDRLLIKIDTQGYEMKTLQGAAGILSKVEIIDIELTLIPLYESQPSFIEMISFLEAHGFVPISFENAFTDSRNGYALQVDAIFVRR